MSKQWEVSLRIKQHIVDGKMSPPKAKIRTTMEGFIATFAPTYEFVKDSLKISNKTTGGAKCKGIGSDFERKIAKQIGEWWWGQPFRRTPNSGGWDKQSTDGQVMASGDLIAPPEVNFPFTIECKHRKESINFFTLQTKSSDCVFDWWAQCCGDAAMHKHEPMLIFSCGRTEYIAVNNVGFTLLEESAGPMPNCIDVIQNQKESETGDTIPVMAGFVVMLLKDFLNFFRNPNGKATGPTTAPTSEASGNCA